MVKRDVKSSVSEEDEEPIHTNQNNKRVKEVENLDGKKKQKTFGLYRQPTVQELNRLQETESLFNSNLFRLQVDEIIQEVKLKEKTEKKFTEWFEKFKTYILEIAEDHNEYDLTEPNLFKRLKVKIPVDDELIKTKCSFKFHKFKNIEIVGSYALGCAINSKLKIDLHITVPADTYTKNDSVNYRYHKKHAAYLAYIASHISKSDLVDEVKYSCLHGHQTKPAIDLKPVGKLGNHLTVQISLICEAEAYKFHRFSPSRNNLRESWLLTSTAIDDEVGPPTPYYNSCVLSDLTATVNQEYLNELLSKSENLKQAIVLLKIWLRQRNLLVSGHIVSLLVAYLVQIKRINNIMSSYQIVRNVWIALKSSELDTKGISLHKGQASVPPLEEFHRHFPLVFIDRTGYYNILWQMNKGTYNALKRESHLAVEMLDNGKINSFIPLFMTPVKPLLQFDHTIRFKDLQSIKKLVLPKVPKESRVNYGVEDLALVIDTLHSLLAQGFGNRVHLIQPLVEADFTWPIKKSLEKAKSVGYEEKLSFGLIYNTETAFNIVEKGPPANLPEAEEFRAFWGGKSELRRFQDGSITETCVWRGESIVQKRTVPQQIVDYLLKLHYDISPSNIFHISDQLSSVTASRVTGIQVEESSLAALQAFDDLRRDLRQLTQLPLDITAVYGVSPVFSYSSPLPPAPTAPQRLAPHLPIPDYTPVCEAIIELGHSGKWPGDIEAFRCLKAAFHLQISDRLHKQYSLPARPHPSHVDVLKNNLVFRLKIAHPKEITLLRKEMENGVAKFKETEESVRLQCDTVLMPRLRGALHGLHTKHPAYGPTACLLKRWLSSHLLSPPHFPSPTAELLCALVFVSPAPLVPPASPTAGLVRVLERLAYTDWATEVVVLDFNEDMTREEITSIEQQLSTSPTRSPLCIATAYDGTLPGVWSSDVTPQVLTRARVLADSTLKYIGKCLDDFKDNLLGAFIPSLSGYDALIYLYPQNIPHYSERVDRPPRPSAAVELVDVLPVVEFHPVNIYLDELRSAYSEFALFFHDVYGGDVIAVLWKPGIQEYKEFQLLAANALTPVTVKGETKYKVNTAALLEDFRILGEGLVKNVTVNS